MISLSELNNEVELLKNKALECRNKVWEVPALANEIEERINKVLKRSGKLR